MRYLDDQGTPYYLIANMKPLTSATTELAVIEMAVRAGCETWLLLQSIRNAPVHVRQLTSGLHSLNRRLAMIQRLAGEVQNQNDLFIRDVLKNLETILTSCMKVFEDVRNASHCFPTTKDEVISEPRRGILRGISKRNHVSKIQQALNSHRGMLGLSLTIPSA